jgi:siroheme synthase (precorrin-2 oxidase/ferrochelatase)
MKIELSFNELSELYKKRLIQFLKDSEIEVTEHVFRLGTSIMYHRDDVLKGGSFVKSIVENDLYATVRYADKESRENIVLFVNILYNCYI